MIKYSGKINKRDKILLGEFISELEDYFDLEIPINLNTCRDRKEFSKKYGETTPNWMVGFAINDNVSIIERTALEKESTHKKEEFLQIAKHEICHLFIKKNNPFCARYFEEGLCLNFAKQIKKDLIKKENLILFLSNFYIPFNKYEFAKHQGYQLSSRIMKNILSFYSKANVLELLKITKQDRGWKNKIEKATGDSIDEFKKTIVRGIRIVE